MITNAPKLRQSQYCRPNDIFELIEVQLFDFTEAGIIFALSIEIDPDGTTLSFESSYGVHGRIKAKRIVVSFQPHPTGSS
jgi:hypothetical protein